MLTCILHSILKHIVKHTAYLPTRNICLKGCNSSESKSSIPSHSRRFPTYFNCSGSKRSLATNTLQSLWSLASSPVQPLSIIASNQAQTRCLSQTKCRMRENEKPRLKYSLLVRCAHGFLNRLNSKTKHSHAAWTLNYTQLLCSRA